MLLGERRDPRADGFAAAGSLPRPEEIARPDAARRFRLVVEIGLLFVLAPIVMRYAVYNYNVPLFYALPPVLLGMIAVLLLDKSYSLNLEFAILPQRQTLVSIAAIFVVGVIAVTTAVAVFMPERLFALASERPTRWLKIMALYPFTSVLAQEAVYRVFFFHRYGPLFRSATMLCLVNAAVFALGHVLFRNWIAVGGTFAVGLLFAWRYQRTQNIAAVYVEHVLWGWLVFTVGLGVYFFTGVRNPAW
jgi:uncharacterized protein